MTRNHYSKAFLTYVQENAGRVPVEEIVRVAGGRYEIALTPGKLRQLCAYHGWSLMQQSLSGMEVAKIMGANYLSVRDRWLTGDPPLLPSRGRYGRPEGGQWWIMQGDFYQFIYRHPEAYDWRLIKREPYRTWGQEATRRSGLLYLEEVCERVDVPYTTVIDWLKKYDIPGVLRVKAGRVRWRFRPESIQHMLRLKDLGYRKTDRPFPLRQDGPTPARLLALLAVEMIDGRMRVRMVAPELLEIPRNGLDTLTSKV